MRFERPGFFLGDADDHDAIRAGTARPIGRDDCILVLARFELDQRDSVIDPVGLDRLDKASCIGRNKAGEGIGWPR